MNGLELLGTALATALFCWMNWMGARIGGSRFELVCALITAQVSQMTEPDDAASQNPSGVNRKTHRRPDLMDLTLALVFGGLLSLFFVVLRALDDQAALPSGGLLTARWALAVLVILTVLSMVKAIFAWDYRTGKYGIRHAPYESAAMRKSIRSFHSSRLFSVALAIGVWLYLALLYWGGKT